jgi:hypothetical protein
MKLNLIYAGIGCLSFFGGVAVTVLAVMVWLA